MELLVLCLSQAGGWWDCNRLDSLLAEVVLGVVVAWPFQVQLHFAAQMVRLVARQRALHEGHCRRFATCLGRSQAQIKTV